MPSSRPSARASPFQQTDDLGRPLPMLETDHMHAIHAGPQPQHTRAEHLAAKFGGSTLLDPPLSPGPPLRGYAAEPLPPSSPGRAQQQAERDAEYQQMMANIIERTRSQNAAQELDEDQRLERMLKHIEHEQEFVEQLDYNLEMRDRADFRRKAALYKEWDEKVFKAVQTQIDQQLAAIRTEDLTKRRQELMEEYIRISNTKRYGLYRDIIIESEYDPMTAHSKTMKYSGISDKNDPLKLEIMKAMTGKPKPKKVGRDTLAPTMWSQLDSTPYGRFDRLPPPAPPELLKMHMSRVNFEHFNVAKTESSQGHVQNHQREEARAVDEARAVCLLCACAIRASKARRKLRRES